jgi:hypothetical protein
MEDSSLNYSNLVERLIRLEVMQQKDLDVAEEWRGRFCTKLDKMADMIRVLPCDKREGRWTSLSAQIKWLWIAMTFVTGLNGVFIVSLINHIGK